jgi:hypothetical protein
MPWETDGFDRLRSWVADANNGLLIDAGLMDDDTNDIASGLTQLRQQGQSGSANWGGAALGTANALTITVAPVLSALAAGNRFAFIPGAANTGPATLQVGALAAAPLLNGAALAGGELQSGVAVSVVYDGTAFQIQGGVAHLTGVTAGTGLAGGGMAGNVPVSLVVPVTVPHGGLGVATVPPYGLLIGRGAAPVGAIMPSNNPNDVLLCQGAAADPAFGPFSGLLDSLFGSAQGSILMRGAAGWAGLPPGAAGAVLSTQGAGADAVWLLATGTGTITGVTAGTGMSGGGLAGNVTLSMVTPVAISIGGTGANAPAAALANLGAAPLASPAFTGTVTAPTVILNQNTAAPQVPPSGMAALLHVNGADATQPGLLLDSYGTQSALLTFRAARGTGASPSAMQQGDIIGGAQFWGYGTAYAVGASFYATASGTWTGASHGTLLGFTTTSPGAVTPHTVMQLYQGLVIGNPAGGDLGPGTVNAQTLLRASGNFCSLQLNDNVVGPTSGGLVRFTSLGTGVYAFQINTASAGDFTAVVSPLVISSSGVMTIAPGASNPLNVQASAGGSACILATIAGLQQWAVGAYNGSGLNIFTISDQTANAPRLEIDTSGVVTIPRALAIGSSTGPTDPLTVEGGSGNDAHIIYTTYGGAKTYAAGVRNDGVFEWKDQTAGGVLHMYILANGTVVMPTLTVINTFTPPSDRRLKDDITPWQKGLAEVLELNPVSFKWNGKAGTVADKKPRFGFVGDEVAKVLPEFVGKLAGLEDAPDGADVDTIDILAMAPLLVNAVKELAAENEDLKKRLELLEVAALKTAA